MAFQSWGGVGLTHKHGIPPRTWPAASWVPSAGSRGCGSGRGVEWAYVLFTEKAEARWFREQGVWRRGGLGRWPVGRSRRWRPPGHTRGLCELSGQGAGQNCHPDCTSPARPSAWSQPRAGRAGRASTGGARKVRESVWGDAGSGGGVGQ